MDDEVDSVPSAGHGRSDLSDRGLSVVTLDALERALAVENDGTRAVESGLFCNEPRRKNPGNAQQIKPGMSEPVLDFSSPRTSDVRGVVVQLQVAEVLAAQAFAESPVQTNVVALVIWGTDGGQQSAEVSIGAGVTFTLAAQFVRVSVTNPLLENTILVTASAAPAAYSPGRISRLVYLQGAMPILAGPFAPALLADGVVKTFKVPAFARSISLASLSQSVAPVAQSDRLNLTQLSNGDTAVNILRVDSIRPWSYALPESPGFYGNVWELDHVPLNPSCNGLRLDVDPTADRFSGLHKLTFALGL